MSYVPIVTPDKLSNKLYQEIIDEITRDNPDIVTEAIDTAIQKTKMYLGRYDPVQIFGDAGLQISASFSDSNLTNYVKTIAMWELLALANPNINYEDAHNRYKDAIRELERIQDGKSNPQWPYLDISTASTTPSLEIYSVSSKKRNNTGYVEQNNETIGS